MSGRTIDDRCRDHNASSTDGRAHSEVALAPPDLNFLNLQQNDQPSYEDHREEHLLIPKCFHAEIDSDREGDDSVQPEARLSGARLVMRKAPWQKQNKNLIHKRAFCGHHLRLSFPQVMNMTHNFLNFLLRMQHGTSLVPAASISKRPAEKYSSKD
ncbi:hypothetical protein FGB62_194g012 [Gracilaria domingensis]|nr:hypothetical protein FGB62_194g012 [Gracilaria domingensis]